VVNDQYMISPVLNDRLSEFSDFIAAQQSPDLTSQRLCQLLTFRQQLQADVGDLSVVLLDENPNVSLSHLGTFILRCIP
jgi:hypothetical protein